jgi:hypothetical protein
VKEATLMTAQPVPATARTAPVGGRLYLAGPFTDVAQPAVSEEGATSGLISPESPWRRILEATERALTRRGWDVFLPHRDVSRWGHRDVAPAQLARECLDAVLGSDCIIAVMARSFGTHVEVGIALGKGIPAVIIEADDESISFFGQAVAGCDMVNSLRLRNLCDLPDTVARGALDNVIRKAFVGHHPGPPGPGFGPVHSNSGF